MDIVLIGICTLSGIIIWVWRFLEWWPAWLEYRRKLRNPDLSAAEKESITLQYMLQDNFGPWIKF